MRKSHFAAKADVVWVESANELAAFQARLRAADPGADPVAVVTGAFVSALDHGRREQQWARHRAELIVTVPAVQAHANDVYGRWRTVIAAFIAERTGARMDDLYPLAVAHSVIAASGAAHEFWLAHPDVPLARALHTMFSHMVPPG